MDNGLKISSSMVTKQGKENQIPAITIANRTSTRTIMPTKDAKKQVTSHTQQSVTQKDARTPQYNLQHTRADITGFQDRLGARDSKSNRNYTEGIHKFKPGIGSKLSGVIQKTLTPSQRRLRGVDLVFICLVNIYTFYDQRIYIYVTIPVHFHDLSCSGPSPPVSTSRLINRSMNSSIKKTIFHSQLLSLEFSNSIIYDIHMYIHS
ncbi:uncharacterized protein LOC108224720 isoform X3 [Daucus carota subsp. sativus]|uniref:uncharacterized protein LOC108224720 isoform X3 n=1 Tax=Daucus carota subsp. sativus TaxID=79200 RepID=UPI0030839CB8